MPMKDVTNIKITINGREYHSLEEVPPELREVYSKAVERARDVEKGTAEPDEDIKVTREVFKFNGRTYNSLEELPPVARAALAKISESDWHEKSAGVFEASKVLSEDGRVIEPRGGLRQGEGKKSYAGLVIA